MIQFENMSNKEIIARLIKQKEAIIKKIEKLKGGENMKQLAVELPEKFLKKFDDFVKQANKQNDIRNIAKKEIVYQALYDYMKGAE